MVIQPSARPVDKLRAATGDAAATDPACSLAPAHYIVEAALAGGVDAHVSSRVDEMRSKYADFFAAHEA